jgi:hypothetical protein
MVRHFVLTLTSSVQSLAAAYPDATAGGPFDLPIQEVFLTPGSGNLNVVYGGGAAGHGTLTSTNYGFRLEAPVSSIPQAPLPFTRGSRLSDYVVLGTNGEKVHLMVTQ